MSTLITINVTNNSPNMQNFYFFQQPAQYVGGGQVYSNSLYSAPLLPNASSGAQLTFWTNLQFYAGAQQQVIPPVVGQSAGQLSAIQPIDLTTASGGAQTNNTTDMSVTPALGLSVPSYTSGPEVGSFRIVAPTYNPISVYNIGSALKTLTGEITLANFVTAQPTASTDCQPILKFYVATGTFTAGTVMNFTTASLEAALCDATTGYTTFGVTYNADGTWSVTPFAAAMDVHGATKLIAAGTAVDIYNEAGTAVICQGTTNNVAGQPLVVVGLTAPGQIQTNAEYQIAIHGQRRRGVMCTQKAGNTASFD